MAVLMGPEHTELPLRAELFSASQLESHARSLASEHKLGPSDLDARLLARLADNHTFLGDAYALLADAVARGRQITPAAEWFVDNYHLIEEQIRVAKRHLPARYSKALPHLVGRALRVYDLALELISHSHGHVDVDTLHSFIAAYQTIQPLRLGELWAIPIMLRIALIENLRRVIAGVTAGRRDRESAAMWADRLLEGAAGDPSGVVRVLSDLVAENPPMTTPFVAELASRLQGQGAISTLPMAWLEQRLDGQGQTIERAFQAAAQSQAADQVAVGNSITSLRTLDAIDWREFVEQLSAVEAILRQDAIYPAMEFATRDRYRHVVETLAARGKLPEPEVARKAIELAAARPAGREHHVGYFLIDDGKRALELALKERPRPVALVRNVRSGLGIVVYVALIALITAGFTVVVSDVTVAHRYHHPAWIAAWSVAVALCASQLAIAIVQWGATLAIKPLSLPRLDFTKGIPAQHKTLVAVPVLLTSEANIDHLVEMLEVRFLANRDPNLAFALIGDYCDAPEQHMPDDAALLAYATQAIVALDAKYHDVPFFLMQRDRRFNARDHLWMGWERKRGKLEDLNAALRGERERFATIVGSLDRLAGTRYVLVLDSDTELPRDAAKELVATMAHPLNRPVIDKRRGRVTHGYAILQPRVGITLDSAQRTRFARMFAGEPGIDPYTRAVSDVYQDLFAEGSFVGKGIYDLDAVRDVLEGTFPDNRVLSHDLLEGAYGRAGLVSDVLVFEDFPSTYAVDASRRARWIRGDWQIARWLFGWIPRGDAQRRGNPISMLSRWKILDNLRRSLVPIAMIVLLVGGWRLHGVAWLALSLVLATFIVPTLLAAFTDLERRPKEVSAEEHARVVRRQLGRAFLRELFSFACLPEDAAISGGAITRVSVRLWLTKRKLLEWKTAADAERSKRTGFFATYLAMWPAPVAAAAIVVQLEWGYTHATWLAGSVAALWLFAPMLVWWAGRPVTRRSDYMTVAELAFLHRLARRTWRFFQTYVTTEDHDLPPDNFQEDPPVGIAHRTSPTNIGLALLANLSAHDFGYITSTEVAARVGRTFATLDQLQRFRGHFYNWYDTRSLEPLRPMYVSTVDSGNLAGHLMTLAEGLRELPNEPVVRPAQLLGLTDTIDVLQELGFEGLVAVREAVKGSIRTMHEARATFTALAAAADSAERLAKREPEANELWWRKELARQTHELVAELDRLGVADGPIPTLAQLAPTNPYAAERVAELHRLAQHAGDLGDFEYDFLYDVNRHQFSIGYSVTDHRLDNSFYDLLASEARLASFVAIAQNKVPQDHWFHLGRRVTTQGGRPTLLSWSGSMFEYLMPLLVMPTYEGTLLDATYTASVDRQIEYGRERKVPWGMSESGYNKTDAQLNYQYRAFGVPGLGFKRGLAADLVVAPYASAMALMVAPKAATANLERLAAEHQMGPFGFYEAIDYTQSRLPPGKSFATVKSYMAHHQGMAFLSIAYMLLDRPMQRRFLANPAVRATDLVLHERVPRTPAVYPHPAEVSAVRTTTEVERDLRVFATPNTPAPEIQLLSNGNYHVVVSNSGGGYSRWRDHEVTRWAEDATRDCWGQFCYVRDVMTGKFWSTAYQPTQQPSASYEAIFSAGRAEFRRGDDELDMHVEIAVSPEDDLELRRITISNHGLQRRTIELTSFAEVVLDAKGADVAHRAFSGLFVQSEIIESQQAILCTRRPRSPGEQPPWLLHLMVVHGGTARPTSYETDRNGFIGRDGTPADPAAMHRKLLGNSQGAVLDPCVAIRNTVELGPDQTIQLHVATGVAETREAALALVDKYRGRHLADRVFELAWAQSQVIQRRLDAGNAEVRLWEQLAGHVIFANPTLRAPKRVIAANRLGQAGLWPYSISGDLPIVIVRITTAENLELVRQLVRAHMYWRLKGLAVDLVIWNEDPSGYRQNVHDQITAAIALIGDASLVDQKGGIFIRRTDQMTDPDRMLMMTVARVILADTAGTLAEQLDRRPRNEPVQPVKFERQKVRGGTPLALPPMQRPDLTAFNGHGGFTKDGREYVIATTRESRTPAPWINVLANSYFGTIVSETGAGYTWCENAQMYRLSPWSNDAVGDPAGEVLYIRDEEDGSYWSPTLSPAPSALPYTTRHGFGYSVFEAQDAGVRSELTVFVAMDAPVKLFKLKLRNRSGRTRKLSVAGYFELVLGTQRAVTLPYVVTEIDARTGALFAHNSYGEEFASRVAFLECSESVRTVSGDRTEFLGRGGSAARPAALARAGLSGRVGAAFDPCFAMHTGMIEVPDAVEREIVFAFGSGRDLDDARYIVNRYRGAAAAQSGLAAVWEFWNTMLGAVHVKTPDESLDYLANGWLIYQVLAARMWGRSGFYQSGGAFGFRDQLQDACALVHAEPALLRDQLVRSATHQFQQGDVQHWWHPPSGRGVRTRISDDYLWLPYATARYVTATGDTGVLDEKLEFIEGRAVNATEDSYYDLPVRSQETAALYDHCVRAIEHGYHLGEHGLPLMGTGDWNDGMNLVGDEGRGESVWLAQFLVDVLRSFEPIARRRGDTTFAATCATRVAELRRNLESHAWDGAWYRRGYYDDGSPLGSATRDECQIDALPQSWAVLSGSGSEERASQALDALDQRLVDRELAVIKLFEPPFDKSTQSPGYIKGYVPGVRENGGQYTHAAVWAVMAFAAAGRTERAWELFRAIDPIHHGDTPEAIARYRVEPYVMAADIYTNPQYPGRGGWTWYTGSAGWMYRLVLESLLGIHLEVDRLRIEPKMPAHWPGFEIHYRHHQTVHHITVKNGGGHNVKRVVSDSVEQADLRIPLHSDGREHWIDVET
ncbi:MAG: glucoamylase family protein [Kofleriaceae bacterium]